MILSETPASASVLAFVTTVHAALLVLHQQQVRGIARLLTAVPACAFAAMAWVLASPLWLATGVASHLAWVSLALFLARHQAPTTPSVPSNDPVAATRTPARAAGPSFVPARVLATIVESESVRTFRVSRPAGFEFEPGQFLMVRVEVNGETLVRCYSISSPPEAAGYLEFSVRRQGLASAALHDSVRAGESLAIHPPLGRFTAPSGDARLVLVGGGIGITPLMSILRHAVAAQPSRPVTLLYSVRDPRDAAFLDEVLWLARRHPQLDVVVTVTGDRQHDGCRRGRIDEALIAACVTDAGHAEFLICGPLPMIDAVRGSLTALGVDGSRVRYEAFEAAAAVAALAARESVGDEGGRLRLTLSGQEVDVAPSETLLDAAERAGARVASFCRAGVCGTCRTRLVAGEVRCTAEALSDEDRAGGYVLPCVARPLGDCALEA
jgi:ferredoxin-NADP reductase